MPLTTAELRSSDVVEKTKRNGGAAKLREASTMAAARARFLRKRRLRLRFGVSRGSRVPFIGAEHGPGRAGPRGTRRRARGRVGLEPESGSVGEEDAPDRRGPPGGESGRGRGAGPERAGSGETGRRGTGWRGVFWAAEREKKKKGRMGWAEREGEKKRPFHFSEMLQLFQIKFKLKDLNLS